MKHVSLPRCPIGNPRRLWRQKNFIISLTNPGPMGLDKRNATQCEKARRAVETAVEAGFNQMELCWASPEVGMEILRTAERLGTNVLYQNLRRFGGMGYSKKPLNEHNDLLGAMRDTAGWKCITGYYMYDEPITTEQRALVRRMIEEAEKERPDLLPFTVTDAGRIDAMADEVDPAELSFDAYPFGNTTQIMRAEDQLDRCDLWYRFEVAKRAAERIGAPLWFVFQGHELFYHPSFDVYTFAASHMMAGAALLYGAKELSSYVECHGVLDPDTCGHGPYFEEHKALNEKVAALGNTLMALKTKRVLHDATLRPDHRNWLALRTPMDESELLRAAPTPRISVAEMEDDHNNRYLMVLNRDYRLARSFKLKLKEPARVWRVSDKDGTQYLAFDDEDSFTGHLAPGDFALYRIQPMSEEPFAIGYYLDEGGK